MTPTDTTRQANVEKFGTSRVGNYETSSPADKYGSPAGISSQRDKVRHGGNSAFYSDINQPIAAGKNTVVNGHSVITSRVDHVKDVIKTERPIPKIQDTQTTYNQTHMKEGFPVHYPPSPPRQPETKIQSSYDNLTSGRRHPYEVKSN